MVVETLYAQNQNIQICHKNVIPKFIFIYQQYISHREIENKYNKKTSSMRKDEYKEGLTGKIPKRDTARPCGMLCVSYLPNLVFACSPISQSLLSCLQSKRICRVPLSQIKPEIS